MAMADGGVLLARVRAALAARRAVREVRMFGGVSLMVNGGMVVSVRNDGDLLVRADPARTDELLGVPGARPAEMGAGRAMSNGWISVSADAVATDAGFAFWLGAALEYNDTTAGKGRPRRGRQRPAP